MAGGACRREVTRGCPGRSEVRAGLQVGHPLRGSRLGPGDADRRLFLLLEEGASATRQSASLGRPEPRKGGRSAAGPRRCAGQARTPGEASSRRSASTASRLRLAARLDAASWRPPGPTAPRRRRRSGPRVRGSSSRLPREDGGQILADAAPGRATGQEGVPELVDVGQGLLQIRQPVQSLQAGLREVLDLLAGPLREEGRLLTDRLYLLAVQVPAVGALHQASRGGVGAQHGAAHSGMKTRGVRPSLSSAAFRIAAAKARA